mmetsp:Transcript_18660/g.33295  ORF Transcript_18660/g.33295 Transcript_18660/m.33295 type:complete len:276 (+) Transcript_18660:1944-2771(+)
MQSVRKPAWLISLRCSLVAARECCDGPRRSRMTLSAPLHQTKHFPSGIRPTMLIRFRSLLNSKRPATSTPNLSSPHCRTQLLVDRLSSWTPSSAAPSTSASSSGDSAWYISFPLSVVPSRCGTTLLHIASASMKSAQRLPELKDCAFPAASLSCLRSVAHPVMECFESSSAPRWLAPWGRLESPCADEYWMSPPLKSSPPMEAHTKLIKFSVRVPVLSDNTYCTCPRSSLSVVVRQRKGVPLLAWNMARSLLKKMHCASLTTSRLTYRLIGMSWL